MKFSETVMLGGSCLSAGVVLNGKSDVTVLERGATIGGEYFDAYCPVSPMEQEVRYEPVRQLQEALREEAKERMLDELALWYDGYCFDEEGATSVFSTWSVLQFFASASNLFDVYWYDAAGMPAVIRNKFRKCDYVQMLEELNVGKPITVTRDVFINPSSLDSMEPHVLLFQTGYLTLAEGYKGVHLLSPTVKLDYPNTEIRKAFSDMLHDVFLPEGVLGDRYRNGNGRANPEFVAALQRRDLDTVMNIINGYFRTVNYEGEPINKEVTATAFMRKEPWKTRASTPWQPQAAAAIRAEAMTGLTKTAISRGGWGTRRLMMSRLRTDTTTKQVRVPTGAPKIIYLGLPTRV